MDKKERAASLLAQGIVATQVAKAVGVTDSQISQWNSEQEFQEKVAESMAGLTQAAIEFDDLLEESELLALENIKRRLPLAKMSESLAAFKILNSATRRKSQHQLTNNAGTGAPLVQIILPTAMIPQFTRNAQSEIVEVDGQTLVSASPKQLQQLVTEKLGRTLPSVDQSKARADRADALLTSVVAPKAKKSPVILKRDVDVTEL